jgi:DNA replication and repair protein RecF
MPRLAHLKLRHFRNYSSLEVEFGSGCMILSGQNGAGKSNLLEAIYYLSLLSSFRTRRVKDLFAWDSDLFCLEGQVADERGPAFDRQLAITYSDRRRLRCDQTEIKRASDFINAFLCVAFVPEDIQLVKGAPAERRRFIDILLSQLNAPYLASLINYNQALKSRNVILKNPERYGRDSLRAYDQQLVSHGAHIVHQRWQFMATFANDLTRLSQPLFGPGRMVDISYNCCFVREQMDSIPSVEELAEMFRAALARDQRREEETGSTRFGPHRDDLILMLDQRQASVFASEGQSRLISLALRLASAEILKRQVTDKGLVLLVDDVMGELDRERRQRFIQSLSSADQIFLACTEAPAEIDRRINSVYTVEDGRVDLAGS